MPDQTKFRSVAERYKFNAQQGYCGDWKRGAPLGRFIIQDAPKDFAGKLTLRRVRLNGDYDCEGTYWGAGAPLFWIANEELSIDFVVRASDREAAKVKAQQAYPNARFHR